MTDVINEKMEEDLERAVKEYVNKHWQPILVQQDVQRVTDAFIEGAKFMLRYLNEKQGET